MASQGASHLQQQNVGQIISDKQKEVDDQEEEISNLQFCSHISGNKRTCN